MEWRPLRRRNIIFSRLDRVHGRPQAAQPHQTIAFSRTDYTTPTLHTSLPPTSANRVVIFSERTSRPPSCYLFAIGTSARCIIATSTPGTPQSLLLVDASPLPHRQPCLNCVAVRCSGNVRPIQTIFPIDATSSPRAASPAGQCWPLTGLTRSTAPANPRTPGMPAAGAARRHVDRRGFSSAIVGVTRRRRSQCELS